MKAFKEIDTQMKNFEEITDYKLPEQSYVVVRLDGKNFSRVTEKLDKPFDEVFSIVMQSIMKQLVTDVDGCIYGFTQSDEITLILHSTRESAPYFNNRLQKISSVVASMATLYFDKILTGIIMDYEDKFGEMSPDLDEDGKAAIRERIKNLWSVAEQFPVFDCRAYSVPEDEYWNVIYWRQQLGYTNAFNAFAEKVLGKDSCNKKSMKQLKQELKDVDQDFDETVPNKFKYGMQIIKVKDENGELNWTLTETPKLEYDEIL